MGANGSSTVSASGGNAPYSFNWSNGRTTAINTGLISATYNVTVTDNVGCSSIGTTTISQPAAINPISAISNVLCFGGNNGFINNTINGGTLPYSFIWSNGATTFNVSGLTAATYNFTVTDGAGCTAVKNANVSQPTALNISFNNSSACFGTNTGSSVSNVIGGTAPFAYLWSNGQTSATATALTAATYRLTVTDANGCNNSNNTTITQTTALSISASAINVSCTTINDGSASVTLSGGNTPYSFSWSNGGLTANISNLSMGMYIVTATDANGCNSIDTAVVSNNPIAFNRTITNVSCAFGADGSAFIQVSGGISPFTYAWSNGSTAAFNSNLTAGIYVVTINDASNCNATISAITITQPTPLTDSVSVSGTSCPTCTDGQAAIFVSGGRAPYSYLWANGSTNSQISNLGIGTYFITVTDANNCVLFSNANVSLGTSINEVWEESLLLFPNPTTNIVNVNGLPNECIITVYNSLGQLLISKVSTQSNEVIDLSNFVPAVYLLQVQHQGQIKNFKVIKE